MLDMSTMRSGSGNGSGLRITERTMLKMAAFAARQTTSVSSAVAVNVRSRDRLRAATRASRPTSASRVARDERFIEVSKATRSEVAGDSRPSDITSYGRRGGPVSADKTLGAMDLSNRKDVAHAGS